MKSFITNALASLLWMSFTSPLLAQEPQTADSTQITQLNEVVLTGESKVMSLSKKLYAVEVMDAKTISGMAANNLADVLNYNLNITVTPDPSTGRSTVSMFGLDGQYVKILLDGIPLTSDNGLGNNIDITQINLEDVERIEIVEGAMGVLYGDNAMAGVINIVSKNGMQQDRWSLQASLQEETIGPEYALFDRGRHVQNLKIDHRLSQNTQLAVGASRNDFAGFYNKYKGKDYYKIEDGTVEDDGLRGTEWNPKEQLTAFANITQQWKKQRLFYKFQYYNEELEIYDHHVNGRYLNGEPNPTATDERYTTDRLVNNLNLSGNLVGKTAYNLSVSYQTQKRYLQQYVYNIKEQGVDSVRSDGLNQSSKILYSKGTVSNIFPDSQFFNLLLGYELSNQKGFDAIASGAYSADVVENRLENYDGFAAADLTLGPQWSFYPRARVTNSSQFGSRAIWSFSSTYDFGSSLLLKADVGSAFRAPNFTELFYYFVDSNHNVQGNPELDPESGISIFVNLDKKIPIAQDKGLLSLALKTYYIDLDHKISLVADDSGATTGGFRYQNVDGSRILGASLQNSLKMGPWQVGLGLGYMGESTRLGRSENPNTDYLWTFNLRSHLLYELAPIRTTFSAQLKYAGPAQTLLSQSDEEVTLGKTDAMTWVDLSTKTILNKNWELSLGVRNLLDIVTVNASNVATGGHGGVGSGDRPFGNGRSYFLKLLYKLTFN